MTEKYLSLIKSFNSLATDDKQKIIIDDMQELLKVLNEYNNRINNTGSILPTISHFEDEDSFYTMIYTYIISLKEENAKLIKSIKDTV